MAEKIEPNLENCVAMEGLISPERLIQINRGLRFTGTIGEDIDVHQAGSVPRCVVYNCKYRVIYARDTLCAHTGRIQEYQQRTINH